VRGGESRGRASAHEGCAQAGGGCDAGRARGGGGSPYTGAATLNKELHDGRSPPRGGPAAASPRGIGPRPLAARWPPEGHQPASVCVGAGRLQHQNKQRRQAVWSRRMPISRVVERVDTCSGSDMSQPCTTRRRCPSCRRRTHAQSSPGRLSSFLGVSAKSANINDCGKCVGSWMSRFHVPASCKQSWPGADGGGAFSKHENGDLRFPASSDERLHHLTETGSSRTEFAGAGDRPGCRHITSWKL